jgi:hypothetical protein
MDRLTKLTLMIVAGVVAMYALLSYARHARAPFETPVVAESQ